MEIDPTLPLDSDGVLRRHGLFQNIDGEQTVNEIESLCMSCRENGTTRLLLTNIPHFKQVIIMAFECSHCGLKNNEIQSASTIAESGVLIKLLVKNATDLNRSMVRSEKSSVSFPDIDLTVSPSSGSLTTVEGVIQKAISELGLDQPTRAETNLDQFLKIQGILSTLQSYLSLENEFTLILDDPSGNSYIENLNAPARDPQLSIKPYQRTQQQDVDLGIYEQNDGRVQQEKDGLDVDLQHDIHTFYNNCSRCNTPCETRMHMLEIPHFKEVIVMSTICDGCGYKSNEVKSGGAISQNGKRIFLKMTSVEDLSRDILKSETCALKIPEVELELEPGTLGGRFTTVEGLLSQIYSELDEKAAFRHGDAVDEKRVAAFDVFLGKLKKVLEMKEGDVFTLILDDPMANSYLQNLYAPDPDPEMKIEDYERTFEDNEEWGLNDMKTENYEELGAVQE